MPADPLHVALGSLVRTVISYYHVKPIRVRVDIEEDPGEPLSWRVREIAGGVEWQQTPLTPPPPAKPSEPSSNGQAKEEQDLEADDSGHFSPCISDILDVIEKARHPLTTTMILNALAKGNKEWSKRTVERYLKMMVDDGTLENPKGARPPGYRFPDWSTTSDKS